MKSLPVIEKHGCHAMMTACVLVSWNGRYDSWHDLGLITMVSVSFENKKDTFNLF